MKQRALVLKPSDLHALLSLLEIPGPTGDEAAVADWLETASQEISGVKVTRFGDNIIAVKGTPNTAIFAHIDSVGYTLAYEHKLIRIGGPHPRDGDPLFSSDNQTGRLRLKGDEAYLHGVRNENGKSAEPMPGSRWVFAFRLKIAEGEITSPCLDDRAGAWAALEALERCPHIAVAFCTGEEMHGHGARVCAEWLYTQQKITQALISDITWHTRHTPCGKGVVVSLRDAFCPRQAFLDRVLALAEESGIPYQREIQSAGSSDGGHILRSSAPIDWVFVGAPSKEAHTSEERIALTDLAAMADLLTYLTDRL